jgi:3-oxoacyl-[acyl-carrier protein] reductase
MALGEYPLDHVAVVSRAVARAALVTGASSGIGRGIAQALVEDGFGVALAARRERLLTELAAELGDRSLAVTTDVSQAPAVELLVRRAVERFGRLDVVVTAAGIFGGGSVEDTDEQAWDQVLDVNLKGTYLVARAALPHLRASRGYLITIASVAGTRGLRGAAAYGTSKWGVRGFTQAFLEEERGRGVRATSISPGYVATRMVGGRDPAEIISVGDVVATVRWLLSLRPIVQVREVILERTLA